MTDASHYLIDEPVGVLNAFLGEMEIDHGGLKGTMAHETLHGSGIDPSLKKMSGIAMPEGMDGNPALVDAGSNLGLSEGALDTFNGHREGGSRGLIATSANSRKNEHGVFMREPITPEQEQGVLWQRDIAILGSLATVDMDHHPLAIDI